MTEGTQVLHIRGVREEARRQMKAGAAMGRVSQGEWLSQAILDLYVATVGHAGEELRARGAAKVRGALLNAAGMDPETTNIIRANTFTPEEAGRVGLEHEDFFPDAERTLEAVDGEPFPDTPMPPLRGEPANENAGPAKKVTNPAKIPGVTRGAKEPLWKNKKKKQLV